MWPWLWLSAESTAFQTGGHGFEPLTRACFLSFSLSVTQLYVLQKLQHYRFSTTNGCIAAQLDANQEESTRNKKVYHVKISEMTFAGKTCLRVEIENLSTVLTLTNTHRYFLLDVTLALLKLRKIAPIFCSCVFFLRQTT